MENTDPNNNASQAPQTPPIQEVVPPQVTEPASPQTPQQPTVTPTPTPSVDVEAIKKDVRESVTGEVSKSLLEKIGGALGLTREEKKTLPTDPDELSKFIREEARKGTQEVLTNQERENQDAETARERQLTEGATRFQTLWTNQYIQLAESGRVPKIVDVNDKNDPDMQAKVKILTKLKTILDENQSKGIDYVPTLKEVFYENPDVLNTATAGGNVPISGGGRVIANSTSQLPYQQLNKASTEDLVARKYNN